MSTITGTKDNFASIAQEGITLVDFWAEWCGPCKMFGPIFEDASEQHEDINFVKVDTETQQELAAQANIRSIPTVFGIKNGKLVFSESGVMSKNKLNDVITRLRELDTDTLA